MRAVSLKTTRLLAGTPKPSTLDGLARKVVLRQLARLEVGRLYVNEGDKRLTFGGGETGAGTEAEITVHEPRFYSDIAFGGSIGAGESYMHGCWSSSDLTAVVRVLLQNRGLLDGLETGTARLTAPVQKLFHWINANTRRGSRRNIAAHYDLGNDFFRLWLDDTMMYSAAVYEREDMSLAEAQRAKLERVCRKLDLSPADHVLEIGTGWGGFAIHAARHYGCHVTTTTISREQFNLARERVRAAGLSDKITLLLKDYRDLRGRYDKLVSIEMIEAVGHRYRDTYFGKCSQLLKPEGMMLLQAITIADQRYEQARRSVDFIQRYIFPGSCLTSITSMSDAITRTGDMRIYHLEDIGPHYANTLRQWRERFFSVIKEVRDLGYPEEFIRMWDFYLSYCEGGFLERAIGDVQMLMVKPGCRRHPLSPPLPGN